MEEIKVSFINEVEKMFKRKKALIVVVLSLASIVLGQIIIIGLRNGFGVRTVNSGEFPILVLSAFANTFLPLFAALVAIDCFSGELSHNTMKIVLLRPASRFKVFVAKLSAVVFFVLMNLMFVMILSTVIGLAFNSTAISMSGYVKVIISYLTTIVPITIFIIIIVFYTNIIKSGTAVFFLSVLTFVGLKVLGLIFAQYSSIFIASDFDWYRLFIADIIPYAKIIRLFFIMLGCGTMFFTAGFYLFDKKDF